MKHSFPLSKRKMVIWGASGHALVVADIIRLRGDYEIAGFLDNVNPELKGSLFAGATILGGNEQLEVLIANDVRHIIIGFGNCLARIQLAETVVKMGFSLIQAIHPSAVIASNATIGTGTVISAGAVIGPKVSIGSNVIINTSASIDHECIIADGAHIGPGVHLGGKVQVGRAAWVAIGSTVIQGIKIGDFNIIEAGSVVVQDIPFPGK